jgi:hypothetical protein
MNLLLFLSKTSLKNCHFDIYRSSSKVEDAADLFVRAANMFKMAKKWAGKCILNFCRNCVAHL